MVSNIIIIHYMDYINELLMVSNIIIIHYMDYINELLMVSINTLYRLYK